MPRLRRNGTAYTDFMPWWDIGMGRGAGQAQQSDGVYVRWEMVDRAQILGWEDAAHERGAQHYNWYVVPEGTMDKISGGVRGQERWVTRPEGVEIRWVHAGMLPEAGLAVKGATRVRKAGELWFWGGGAAWNALTWGEVVTQGRGDDGIAWAKAGHHWAGHHW